MVNVSTTFRVDVKLTIGAETQTVNVVADALTVQADSNVVSTLITSEDISYIATENRNFVGSWLPSVWASARSCRTTTLPGAVSANFTISINGLRQSHNIWLIDGGESDDRGGAGGMQIQPSQDAIAEFQMLTSNYPPDYGISSGATISLSLKCGTNNSMDRPGKRTATPTMTPTPISTSCPIKRRVRTKWNIYGFNIGGPLYIPKTYNVQKKKTFFFWNEEWRKTTNQWMQQQSHHRPARHTRRRARLSRMLRLLRSVHGPCGSDRSTHLGLLSEPLEAAGPDPWVSPSRPTPFRLLCLTPMRSST